ncbi:MAG: 16S rRNA (guanine(527)-N(7))-methyltransferase RsmG [Firmicutes bacterium]|nr:16S rRNA (guanine(527)-N(7))-methyltransferase RsmG [Bacillota bacterium]
MEERIFLENGFKELNIRINKKSIDELLLFKDMLLEWNKKINLTSITDNQEIFIKHFLDSATCMATGYIRDGFEVVDIGTGAGFPGLVLKILNNKINITLLDSLKKRTNYLENLVTNLGLKNVEIIHGRAEEYGNKEGYREKYDVALSRAVASINVLLEYCLPYIKEGGYFLCQKGPNFKDELKEAEKAIKVLGGKINEIKEFILPGSDIKRNIIVIEKIYKTPAKYPRKAGKPTSNPIK